MPFLMPHSSELQAFEPAQNLVLFWWGPDEKSSKIGPELCSKTQWYGCAHQNGEALEDCLALCLAEVLTQCNRRKKRMEQRHAVSFLSAFHLISCFTWDFHLRIFNWDCFFTWGCFTWECSPESASSENFHLSSSPETIQFDLSILTWDCFIWEFSPNIFTWDLQLHLGIFTWECFTWEFSPEIQLRTIPYTECLLTKRFFTLDHVTWEFENVSCKKHFWACILKRVLG